MPRSRRSEVTDQPERASSSNAVVKARVLPHPIQFARVEKNLASLGFFSPSTKQVRSRQSKTVRFTRIEAGNRVETTVTIVPAGNYGLPVTADQDRYLAFQQLVTERRKAEGKLRNPIGFTSASLHALMGSGDAGKNFEETAVWLKRMTLTGIISEGVVYLAKRKVRASDTFHVFDRAVSMGQELPDGRRATQNYVWLSSWQLENLNSNYVVPLDLPTYRDLTKHIAKALVPLLQVWLYASEAQGEFGKQYYELCDILNIRRQTAISKIRQQLEPSLEELVRFGYLKQWAITQVGECGRTKLYKVVFYHGPKYYRDRHLGSWRGGDELIVATGQGGCTAQSLVDELTSRGVGQRQAVKLLSNLAEDQDVLAQLEWVDVLAAENPSKIHNPAGFCVTMIRDNVAPPDSFETSEQRRLKEIAGEERVTAARQEARRKLAYEDYVQREVARGLGELSPDEYEMRLAAIVEELKRQYSAHRLWSVEVLRDLAKTQLANEIRGERSLVSYSDFRTG